MGIKYFKHLKIIKNTFKIKRIMRKEKEKKKATDIIKD